MTPNISADVNSRSPSSYNASKIDVGFGDNRTTSYSNYGISSHSTKAINYLCSYTTWNFGHMDIVAVVHFYFS